MLLNHSFIFVMCTGNWAPLEVGVLRSKTTMSPSAGDPELDNVIGDVETEFSLTPRRQYNRRSVKVTLISCH